jgi:hypothetical protein
VSVSAYPRYEHDEPLVAVLSAVPILGEALTAVLESIAEVRRFPAHRGDTAGLLQWLRPDAVVVDSDEEAEAAAGFARETGAPLVHISLASRAVRVWRDGGWEEAPTGADSSETIRNAVVGGLFGRRRT